MSGAPQAGDSGRDAGERVGAAGAGEAHGRCRGVLLVVGVQDQDPVHRPGDDGIDLVVLARVRKHHVQEVFRKAQIVARIHEGLTLGILVRPCRDRRHLRDQPVRRHHALVRVRDVGAVVIEGGQRADHTAHDGHRMRVAPESPVEVVQLLVQHGVVGDVGHELALLPARRQFAVEQQVADLEEIAFLGQFPDGVSAVQQDAVVAVDEGNLGFAASG